MTIMWMTKHSGCASSIEGPNLLLSVSAHTQHITAPTPFDARRCRRQRCACSLCACTELASLHLNMHTFCRGHLHHLPQSSYAALLFCTDPDSPNAICLCRCKSKVVFADAQSVRIQAGSGDEAVLTASAGTAAGLVPLHTAEGSYLGSFQPSKKGRVQSLAVRIAYFMLSAQECAC